MNVLKDIRIAVFLILTILSVYLIISPMLSKQQGVFVVKVSTDAKCTNVNSNSRITQVATNQIRDLEDFNSAVSGVNEGEFVLLISDGLPANCVALADGDLGFIVAAIKKAGIVFGIDIEGGSRVLLKPKGDFTRDQISETIETLTTRINLYGLRDLRIYPVGGNLIQIEMGGATSQEIIDFLSRQGKFEGKLEHNIKLKDGMGSFVFAGAQTTLKVLDGKVELGGGSYGVGETFEKDGIVVDVDEIGNDTVKIRSGVFGGEDIVAVFTDAENSYIRQQGNAFEFAFVIQTSQSSAERFAKLTENQPVRIGGGERYIEPELVLLLDGEEISRLNVVASLAGEVLTKPSIQGFSETREGAVNERLKLQTVLKSGSLPLELEIIKTDVVTQTAGKSLLNSTIYVALAAALIVSVVILFRYRDFRIAVPMVLVSFSEIIIVLGFAAFTQIASKGAGWVLDIPAIAGLIAIIGTGVNQLIIITDQILQEPDVSLKYRHHAAMSIIFNSAYIVIAAMLPLMIAGIGILRGFAITTIIGILIAIFVTRPAYMAILEKVKKLA